MDDGAWINGPASLARLRRPVQLGARAVIPGRCTASNPESKYSGSPALFADYRVKVFATRRDFRTYDIRIKAPITPAII
jgi:hypothetical protein